MSKKERDYRILIVDDAPENIKVLNEALKTDYKISFATNGKEALRIAANEASTDLILLDIVMPGIDGYEVCKRLKADERTSNIPIIFITAKNEEEDETRGFELGAVDYITKPFSKAIVKARVRTHLELKRHRDILENLSSLDGLTGIPNRRRFEEFIEMEWRSAIREKQIISMIMIDIDFFKAYNDTYGHIAGDDCLKQVAKALAQSVQRPMDFVARYGGEEFAVVLPGADTQGAFHVAEKMRKHIEGLNIEHRKSCIADHVTISLGVASFEPGPQTAPATLVDRSDKALYRAKRNGRNKVTLL